MISNVGGTENDRIVNAFEIASSICVISAIIFPLIITVIAFYVHGQNGSLSGADRPHYASIWKTFWNMGDFYSDAIFAAVLLFKQHWCAKWCIMFTLCPHIISNISCLVKMQMWRSKDKYISKYINQYDWFIIFFSVFSGFYSAIELASSRLFYWRLFGLQMRSSECDSQRTWRFFNNVILEVSANCKQTRIKKRTVRFLCVVGSLCFWFMHGFHNKIKQIKTQNKILIEKQKQNKTKQNKYNTISNGYRTHRS